jgi:hypothetical protein
MNDPNTLASRLENIDVSKISGKGNDAACMRLVKAARSLADRLEGPHHRMCQMVWVEPFRMVAMKTAGDMGLFKALDEKRTKGSEELATETGTGAEGVLVSSPTSERREEKARLYGEWARNCADCLGWL